MGKHQAAKVARAAELAAEGKTRAEALTVLGVTRATLRTYERLGKFSFIHANRVALMGLRDKERAEKMTRMYRQGLPLVQIGEHFQVTRERVRQILKKQGVTRADGGARRRKDARRQATAARQEAMALSRWGIPRAQAMEFRHAGVTILYERQRNSARQRGIEFALSLVQWWDVWQASGKWEQRGRGKGKYCMSRIKDSGGYEVGNVHIQLCTDNSKEAVAKWRGKAKENRGVFNLLPGMDRPWLAKVGRVSLGRYATEEEAVAARMAYIAANGLNVRADGSASKAA